ncbi:MAG: 6,7-dimethyl-8-ribityllumazine synthase [Cyclobacteriaceae bacterium]|jgi:6,7-dimethyl-8-ribityllumazine synthase
MASSEKNLSDISLPKVSNIASKKIGIVVAEWNTDVTEALYAGALSTFLEAGVLRENIVRWTVPGSFELTLGAQWLAKQQDIDAVVTLGCVIQGETRHFDFICQAVATGITDVNLKYDKPVIFGVLTTDTKSQAMARAGGKHGNKGDEAAASAIHMLALKPN